MKKITLYLHIFAIPCITLARQAWIYRNIGSQIQCMSQALCRRGWLVKCGSHPPRYLQLRKYRASCLEIHIFGDSGPGPTLSMYLGPPPEKLKIEPNCRRGWLVKGGSHPPHCNREFHWSSFLIGTRQKLEIGTIGAAAICKYIWKNFVGWNF